MLTLWGGQGGGGLCSIFLTPIQSNGKWEIQSKWKWHEVEKCSNQRIFTPLIVNVESHFDQFYVFCFVFCVRFGLSENTNWKGCGLCISVTGIQSARLCGNFGLGENTTWNTQGVGVGCICLTGIQSAWKWNISWRNRPSLLFKHCTLFFENKTPILTTGGTSDAKLVSNLVLKKTIFNEEFKIKKVEQVWLNI